VLAFTGVVVFVTALLFRIVPAIQGSRPNLTVLLNESARGSSGGAARQRLRLVMVAGQTGLALVLLIAAGLMMNSFARLQGNDLGADTEGVLTFRVLFSQEETITFTGEQVEGVGLWRVNPLVGTTVDQVYEQLRLIPGIESVAAVNLAPFTGALSRNVAIFGAPPAEGPPANASYIAVTPGYFETLGIELRRGRVINETDRENSLLVVVVNESMAAQFWDGEDPIGESLTLNYVPGEQPRQVVGIVGDVAVSQFAQQATPIMYVPQKQQTEFWRGPEWGARAATYFLVRGRGEPLSLVPDVQRAVAQVDPDRPVTQIRTIDQYLSEQMQGLTIIVWLLGAFGSIAGALAVSGIYGVISYSVAQRTHEIGVRMALGASQRSIFRLIMRQAVIVVLVGLAIGGIGALLLTRLIGGVLVGVSSTDPLTFAGVSLLLLAAALVACAVPTFRALRVDPLEALRYD
jgi:putative ABC transport system permease protein